MANFIIHFSENVYISVCACVWLTVTNIILVSVIQKLENLVVLLGSLICYNEAIRQGFHHQKLAWGWRTFFQVYFTWLSKEGLNSLLAVDQRLPFFSTWASSEENRNVLMIQQLASPWASDPKLLFGFFLERYFCLYKILDWQVFFFQHFKEVFPLSFGSQSSWQRACCQYYCASLKILSF